MVLRSGRKQTRRGFTLMEVLVVVAILVILASLASVGVFYYLEQSKENAALIGVQTLDKAVNSYAISHNGTHAESLDQLTVPEEGKPASLEPSALIDPWGRRYVYEPNTRSRTGKPLIYSLGANPGSSRQIRNWQ
jgi:general secretion pathway protein G